MRTQDERAAAVVSDPRWPAVCARDDRADGAFLYAVRTTGVFCRPSCPSRQARPENVSFHATAEEARRAGYRPCRRCRPDLPPADRRRAQVVARVCRHIEDSEGVPTLAELAVVAGWSPYHLHRVFREATGLTPAAYARGRRAGRAREALAAGRRVTEAVLDAGYGSPASFHAEAPAVLGMPPRVYGAGGTGQTVAFALLPGALGRVLIAATARGMCALLLGDDDAALERDLRGRFPRATLTRGDDAFEAWARGAVGAVDEGLGERLPLDVRGTVFQVRVWEALRGIPRGETRTYAQLAEAAGSPGAARAVASACAANPVAIAVPCHRVVRADGELTGYRWGRERKQALLDAEAGR